MREKVFDFSSHQVWQDATNWLWYNWFFPICAQF